MTWTTRPRSEGAGNLSVWQVGSGPALVLIHGVGLRAEAWAATIPDLARKFTVFAVDMPGHGASSLNGVRGLEEYVSRVLDFVDSLDGPVRLAGHSMGAILSLKAAVQRPDKVVGVAALNAIYRRSPAAAEAVQNRAADLSRTSVSDPSATLDRWFGSDPEGPLKLAADACRLWLTSVDPEGYASAYSAFAHQDGPTDEELSALSMPSLFLTGENDPNSTPAMSQAMADGVPSGRARSIPGAAHMMPMTHPAEMLSALLETFGEDAHEH